MLSWLLSSKNTSRHHWSYNQDWKPVINHWSLLTILENSCHMPLTQKLGLELILKNNRPVSNLCFLSKVVEKCMLKQFVGNYDSQDLIPQYQSAYRVNHSCKTSLLKLLNDALWKREYSKVTILTAMDLSMAFGTVDHDILLNILQDCFGITGTALNWFDSSLRPWLCVVTVQKARSSDKDLSFSVPMGSCTGPVLFLTYTSCLPQVVDSGLSNYGFADDHNLGCSFTTGTSGNRDELDKITTLTNSLKSINTWMNRNRLCMNNSKTEVLIIGSQPQLNKYITTALDINGTMVQTSKMIKYLGACLDNGLSFKHHISTKCRTAMWNLQCLKLLWLSLTMQACMTLVLELVMAHLDYVNSAFIGLPASDNNKMQRVQNAAAKFVLNLKRIYSSTEALKMLHWLPIKFRIQFKILLLVYKCLNGQAPSYLSELLELKVTISRLVFNSHVTEHFSVYPSPREWCLQICHLV